MDGWMCEQWVRDGDNQQGSVGDATQEAAVVDTALKRFSLLFQ
jgi:hypothetical protein